METRKWLCILIASLHKLRLLIIHYALQRSRHAAAAFVIQKLDKVANTLDTFWVLNTDVSSLLKRTLFTSMNLLLQTHHSCLVAAGAKNSGTLHFISGRWVVSIFDMSNCTEQSAAHRNFLGQLHNNPVGVKNEVRQQTPAFQKPVTWLKVLTKESGVKCRSLFSASFSNARPRQHTQSVHASIRLALQSTLGGILNVKTCHPLTTNT